MTDYSNNCLTNDLFSSLTHQAAKILSQNNYPVGSDNGGPR